MLARDMIKSAAEAVLFVCGRAVAIDELADILEVPLLELRPLMNEFVAEYNSAGRGLRITVGADGYRLGTNPDYADILSRLTKTVRKRFSQAALETLAIIAYRQPVTKAEIDKLRGIKSDKIINNLLELNLIAVTGNKETLGNPALYGTTPDFLREFGLAGLEDLPGGQEGGR
ncbi:MAG: SMC-Scp complex subunit ScpB [Syntrophomonadaceae bacterium]|jgi:segregation and condensation protein B|nr:SMC-Scp complex subunit ScpB [Syntrophomonadaceae bacterium]